MTKHLVHELPIVIDSRGVAHTAAVMGSLADDGLWDGFIELHAEDGTTLITPLETRQPNLADLVYWSTGLSAVYLQGALTRARAAAASEEQRKEAASRVLERGLRGTRAPRRSARGGRGASRGRAAPSRPR